jgi:Kef-type K+ transport system membrane component KefB
MTHFLQLLVLLSVIIAAAKLAGAAAHRIGQPAVFGEILAGLLLGPTLLDMLHWPIFHSDFLSFIHDLAEIGVLLLMFVAGLETDLEEMRRVGRVAFWAAFGGVLLPMLIELGALRSREGSTILGAAVIDDVMGLWCCRW